MRLSTSIRVDVSRKLCIWGNRMFCNNCRAQLPPASDFCPQCGTTVAPDSTSGTISYTNLSMEQKEKTSSVSEKSNTTQDIYSHPNNSVPPPQYYYNVVPQDPYNAPPTYDVSPPIAVPPQQQPPRRSLRTAVIVSIVVVVLLTSCISIFTALSGAINNGLKSISATPGTTTQNTKLPIAQKPNPYTPFTGQLVLADPLGDNSQGYQWSEANNASLYCQFVAGAYRLRLAPQSQYKIDWCFAGNTNYSNLAFEVEMTIAKGDCAGLIFHNAGDRELYYFCITHLGGYGLYLYYKNNAGVVQVKELAKGSNSAIYTGYNIKNLIAVSANGGNINLYVNHQKIQSVVDKTFLQGGIGLATHKYESQEADILYQNAKVWTF